MSKKRDMEAEFIEFCMENPVKARTLIKSGLTVMAVAEKRAAATKDAKATTTTARPARAAATSTKDGNGKEAAAPARGRVVSPGADGELPAPTAGLPIEGGTAAPN